MTISHSTSIQSRSIERLWSIQWTIFLIHHSILLSHAWSKKVNKWSQKSRAKDSTNSSSITFCRRKLWLRQYLELVWFDNPLSVKYATKNHARCYCLMDTLNQWRIIFTEARPIYSLDSIKVQISTRICIPTSDSQSNAQRGLIFGGLIFWGLIFGILRYLWDRSLVYSIFLHEVRAI